MKTKKVNISRVENIKKWEDENPEYVSIPFSDTLRMRKYRGLDTVSLLARRWRGDWYGYGNFEVVASYVRNK